MILKSIINNVFTNRFLPTALTKKRAKTALKRDKKGKFLPSKTQKTRKRTKRSRRKKAKRSKKSRKHGKSRCSNKGATALFQFMKCNGSKKRRRK